MIDSQNLENITRNQAQQKALFAVYDVLTYVDMKEDIDVEMIISGLLGTDYASSDVFVKDIVISSIKHLNEVVAALNEHMQKWTFARLNRVEQAILLMSYVHFFYLKKPADKGVIIDIAVKFSKIYLDPTDYRFVNAILDKVLVKA